MRSIAQALMWETFSHGRWWILGMVLLGNLLPMLIFGALSPYEIDPDDTAFLTMHLVCMPLIMFQFGAGIVAAQGSMSRLYTKPISTPSLVAWRMFPGGILLALEVAVAGWMYSKIYHLNWPILGPSLFAVTSWSSLQVLVSVSQKKVSSFLLAVSPSFILFGWLQSRYGGWFTPPKYYWTNVMPEEIATMSGAVAVAYWLTVIAVKRDRCGEPMPSLGGWKWIVRTWESFGAKSPINLRAFQSPAEAHFWYEWRLKGWAMPLIVILGYLFIGSMWSIQMISGVYHGNAIFDFQEVNFMSGAMIAGVAGFIGLLIGISSTGSANRNHSPAIGDLFDQKNAEEMGHFLSTRPFTNSDFGKTCLRMTGRSLLITWTIWMAIFMSGLIAEATTRPIHTPFFKFAIGAWYLPLVMLGSWITMANLSAIGLSGRGTRLIFTFVSGIIGLAIAATVIEQRCSDDVQQNVYQGSLWIASIAALMATPIAIRKAHRRGLLSVKALWILAAVSAGIAVPVIAVESKALPILAYPMILAFAALFILPFATIPLAISWNRHR